MECIGLRNLGPMAVSGCPNWRPRRNRPRLKQNHRVVERCCNNSCLSSSLRVRASGSGGESCVAVKEDFADEEDYVKAGGSELVFVQMQQRKDMDKQSKLADKVSSFFPSVLF